MQKELVDSRWKAFPVDKKDVRRLKNFRFIPSKRMLQLYFTGFSCSIRFLRERNYVLNVGFLIILVLSQRLIRFCSP